MNMYVKSPFNYIGGKTKILPELLKLFPNDISTFVEPFCGGYNVGSNVKAKKIIGIDFNKYLIELLDYIKNIDSSKMIKDIESVTNKYSLNLSNVDGYNKLRADYNKDKNPLYLFVLICFSFNHQIRFNNNFSFNTPFGKDRSCFNKAIKENLIKFSSKLKEQKVEFICGDFEKYDYSKLPRHSFVYCDPPYIITTGSYNDGKRGFGDWTIDCEKRLLSLLDKLNSKGIKFALSNVLIHKGRRNDTLEKWAKNYNTHFIDKNYNNSNYQSKAKEYKTVEVLITNY